MQVRPTVRVLLLDPEDRLLLFRGRLPAEPDSAPFWFTCGGGVEAGETVEASALREIFEETGIADADLGPAVWRSEGVMPGIDAGDPPRLFQETFVVARCAGGALARDGWTELENRFMDDARWWTLAEIAGSAEVIYPKGLAGLLPDVLARRWPAEPITIGWD